MPRVSVIIPAFNAEAYLAETLASVEAQTYCDWEVIVADDGSTDATAEIVRGFGGRFAVLDGGANEGPAAARNRAIAASGGELLAFLDSDDLWQPHYLERLAGLYDESRERGERPGIVACNARMLGPDGLLPWTHVEVHGFAPEWSLDEILDANPIFGGAIAPRALVDEVGGFCPEIRGTEDYDLWLRILELGYRVVATREALTVYRLRPSSVSTDSARMARSMQLTYRRALERGNLTRRQRRIARRELRCQTVAERVASGEGTSYGRMLRALPMMAIVAVEHPRRWPRYARRVMRRAPATRFTT